DAHAAQLAASSDNRLLHSGEAAQELVVGSSQALLGVDAHPLCQVHQGKEQVAQLFGAPLLALFILQFGKLFADLVEHTFYAGPVEAHAGGAHLKLLGAFEGWHSARHAQQQPCTFQPLLRSLCRLEFASRFRLGFALSCFDDLPVSDYVLGPSYLNVSEYVWVTPYQLGDY